MQDFPARKQNALELMRETALFAREKGQGEITRLLEEERQRLEAGEFFVAVCGECKRGKSSLIGAFLEDFGLCPVNASVATNCNTYIRYGEKEEILVTLLDGQGRIRHQAVGREELRDYVTEQHNEGNHRQVRQVDIQLPNPFLKEGLVLIDTPGVGSLNPEHTAMTYSIIPYVDAVIFVGSADQPVTTPELDFAKRIFRHTENLLHVVTKRDAVPNATSILEENLFKLSRSLERDPRLIPGVAVSSKNKQDYLRTGDTFDLEESHFEDLRTEMDHLLQRRASILLGRAQSHLIPSLDQLRKPLAVEHETLSAKSREEIAAMDARLRDQIERANLLLSDSAQWTQDLNVQMGLLKAESNRWLSEEFIEIDNELGRCLRDDKLLANPPAVGEALSSACNGAFASISRQAEESLDGLVLELKEATALDISAAKPSGRAFGNRVLIDRIAPQDRGKLETMTIAGGRMMRQTGAFAAIFGVGGAILGGLLGLFGGPAGAIGGVVLGSKTGAALGAAIGSATSVGKGIEEVHRHDLAFVRSAVSDQARVQLARVKTDLQSALAQLLAESQAAIQKSLTAEIRREQQASKEAANALSKALQMKKAQAASRLQELAAPILKLEQLGAAARTLLPATEPQPLPAAEAGRP